MSFRKDFLQAILFCAGGEGYYDLAATKVFWVYVAILLLLYNPTHALQKSRQTHVMEKCCKLK